MKFALQNIMYLLVGATLLQIHQCTLCKVSRKEKAQIDKWLLNNKQTLNAYGDPHHHSLRYSSDLFGKGTKYDYIKRNHPDAPWSALDVRLPRSSKEVTRMKKWLADKKLNLYGDPQSTVYRNNPLMRNGTLSAADDLVAAKFPDKPWNKPPYKKMSVKKK